MMKKLCKNTEITEKSFRYTQDKQRSRKEYLKLIGQSKIFISVAMQENFGVSLREAMELGCYPIVPNKLSYVEIVPKEYRYDDIEECMNMIRKLVKKKKSFKRPIEGDSTKIIVKEVLNIINN